VSGPVRVGLFCLFALPISIADVRSYRIPDRLLAPFLVSLLLFDGFFERDLMFARVMTALGTFLFFLIIFRFRGGLGFGDVKYAGVLGYVLGPRSIVSGMLYGVVLALAFWWVGNVVFGWDRRKRIAFGPWLSCGAAAAQALSGMGLPV
jgi:Flp pilus assembly protein protease CpaA